VEFDIKTPLKEAQKCHQQILKELEKYVNIRQSNEGQKVLTVLIQTRPEDDIEKAMRAANIPAENVVNSILLRLLPIAEHDAKDYKSTEKQQKFKLDLTFLIDIKCSKLLDCNENKENFSRIFKFFKT